MIVPFNAALHRKNSIRLFRRLLRESGYLPDHVTRTQIKNQVIHRFRSNRDNRIKRLRQIENYEIAKVTEAEAAIDLLEKRLITGQSWLKTLRNANHGGLGSLRKTLLYAYGRTGKRRYELLEPLLVPENGLVAPVIQQSDGDYILHLPTKAIFTQPKTVKDSVEFSIAPQYTKLNALVKSQLQLHRSDHVLGRGSKLKTLTFTMRRYNIWRRHMPQKRTKNMLNKWYARFMDNVLPPLPDWEWRYLRDLANGTESLKMLDRRKGSRRITQNISSQELEVFLHSKMRHDDRPTQDSLASSDIAKCFEMILPRTARLSQLAVKTLDLDSARIADQILDSELEMGTRVPIKRNRKNDHRALSPRVLRRLYGSVFRHCAHVEKTTTGSWRVNWGSASIEQPKTNPSLSSLQRLVLLGQKTSMQQIQQR